MSDKNLLSIIIPVYNTERYLRKCLESVLRQADKRVEVVIVDDGSTDDSYSIIESYTAAFCQRSSIRIIRQKNSGPGAARNAGILASRGDYLGFLDSDDMLSDDYVSSVLALIDDKSPDLIEFPFLRFTNDEEIPEPVLTNTYGLSGTHTLDAVREKVFCEAAWFPCTRVYSRAAMEGVSFPESSHYEDLMTIPFIFLKPLTIHFHDKPLLYYRFNPESITSRHTPQQLQDILGFFDTIDDVASLSLAVLKVRVARTIVYFFSEIRPAGFPIREVVRAVRRINIPDQIVSSLLPPDRMFYRWPDLYRRLELVRIPIAGMIGRLPFFDWARRRVRPEQPS